MLIFPIYYKQLLHLRMLAYDGDVIIWLPIWNWIIALFVLQQSLAVLGIIDFCVEDKHRDKGIGSSMLSELVDFAETREVDFIILISEQYDFFLRKVLIELNVYSLG